MILVDSSRVALATCAGMAELIHALRKARENEADLRVFGDSSAVRTLHSSLGLDRLFAVYDDRGAALNRDRLILRRSVSESPARPKQAVRRAMLPGMRRRLPA